MLQLPRVSILSLQGLANSGSASMQGPDITCNHALPSVEPMENPLDDCTGTILCILFPWMVGRFGRAAGAMAGSTPASQQYRIVWVPDRLGCVADNCMYTAQEWPPV